MGFNSWVLQFKWNIIVGVTIAYTYKKSYRQLQDLLTPTSDKVKAQEHIITWARIITAKHTSAEKGGCFIYDFNNNSIDIEKVPNGKRATYFSARKRGHSLTKWLLSAQVQEAKLTVNSDKRECLQPWDIQLIIAYEWWVERPLCIKSDMWLFSSEKSMQARARLLGVKTLAML